MKELLPWLSVGVSVLMVAGYEFYLLRGSRRSPGATARSAHRMLRAEWVHVLSRQPNSEILAVQALRNSLMSATITASTAALLLMGSVSLMAHGESFASREALAQAPLLVLLEVALVLILFAAYVCSALAMRYYHHAGFMLSMPVGSPDRKAREPLASSYVQQAGVLYSWSLRCFLFVAPIAIGLLHPLAMPLTAFALLFVLRLFDRTGVSSEG